MSDFLEIGSPIKDFVSSFLEQVNKEIEEQGFVFCKKGEANAEIELNAVETKEVGDGFKIHIFNAGGSVGDTNSQKMKIYLKKPSEADKEEEKARIEQAKVVQEHAFSLLFKSE